MILEQIDDLIQEVVQYDEERNRDKRLYIKVNENGQIVKKVGEEAEKEMFKVSDEIDKEFKDIYDGGAEAVIKKEMGCSG
jgi:hypothetical protein